MKDYLSILFPYAYNIIGSTEDAKDAIQDVLLKYKTQDVQVGNEKNYLIRAVINQSINAKRQKKKKQSEDVWLPEPISTESSDLAIELREMVSYSILFLLERLGSKERAVFVLKEAFAYTHQEIAEVLSVSVENSRKLLSRAHTKIQMKNKLTTMSPSQEQFEYVDRFASAVQGRRLDELHELLSADVIFRADGGEKIRVVEKQCSGVDKVAELLVFVYHKFQKNYTFKPLVVNHQPALLYFYKEKLMLCQVFEFESDSLKIKSVNVVLDLDKLKKLPGML